MGSIKVANRAIKRPTTSETSNLRSTSDFIQAADRGPPTPSRPAKKSSPDKTTMHLVVHAVKPDPPRRIGIPPGGPTTLVFNWV